MWVRLSSKFKMALTRVCVCVYVFTKATGYEILICWLFNSAFSLSLSIPLPLSVSMVVYGRIKRENP